MLKPIGERVIVKRVDAQEKTASGIVIPSQAQEKTQIAEIIEVGSEVKTKELKKGDKVVFKKYSGTELKIDAEELIICEMEDILAVIK